MHQLQVVSVVVKLTLCLLMTSPTGRTYNENSAGLSTDPCGTPVLRVWISDVA